MAPLWSSSASPGSDYIAGVQPDPDRVYAVDAQWRGERHHLEIVFSARFCDELKNHGADVDLERGDLIGKDGTRQDMLGARAPFENATHTQAPPWLFRLPKSPRAFVLA